MLDGRQTDPNHGAHNWGTEFGRQIIALAWLGNVPERSRQIVLAGRIRDMGPGFGPLARQVIASAQQVAGASHVFRIDIGQRKRSAAQQYGDLVGIDLVVLGLAAVNGAHIENVTEDEVDPLFGTETGQSVPSDHALAAEHQLVTIRFDQAQEDLRAGGDVLVNHDFPRRV